MLTTLVHATFDWSNLDVTNFKYFKYPRTTPKPIFFQSHGHIYSIRRIPEKPSKFEDLINRSKAVVQYLSGVAFGKDGERSKTKHIVDPEAGEKLSQRFQQKHGPKAEKLVEFLGAGPSRENLIRANVI